MKNSFLFARVDHLCPCRIKTQLLFAFEKVFFILCFVQKRLNRTDGIENEGETDGRTEGRKEKRATMCRAERMLRERAIERLQNELFAVLRPTNFLMASKILIFSDSFDVVCVRAPGARYSI